MTQMAYVTPDKFTPYPRVCDVCGQLRSIATMRKLDAVSWVCNKHTGERTRIMLDTLNAHARPPQTWPNKEARPQNPEYPNSLEADEGAAFAFIDRQIQSQLRYELVMSGSGPYLSAGGGLPAMAWAARYLYGLIQQGTRKTMLARARILLGQAADYLQARQRGFGLVTSSTRATDAFYGGFLVSGATSYVTQDASTSGLALLYAYRVLGTLSYRDGARAAASYLRNVQAIGSNGSQFTSSDVAGTARLYTGAVASQVSTTAGGGPAQNFYSNHLFYPGDLVALEFWNELKLTDGDQSVGATTAVNGFDSIPAQLLSTSIDDMRECWATGITDATGTLVNGLSSTTPAENFNAYPLLKVGFPAVIGTGRWEYVDGGASTGTQISALNFAAGLASLYAYEGATSQATTILAWLRDFDSNPDFETPDDTSPSVLARSTTGEYDPTVAFSTLLTVRDANAAYAATAVNGSSLYDWGAFGVLSPLMAAANMTTFKSGRLGALNVRQRFDDGTASDGLSFDRIELRGLCGLSFQTAFSSDTLNPGTTQSYSGSSGAGVTTPPMTGLVQWVKGDAGTTLVSTNRLSSWADQSGKGQHFLQSTAGERPYMLGDTLNGIPLVSFGVAGDANKHMETAGNFVDRNGTQMDGSSTRTVMAIAKPAYDAAYGRTGGMIWNQATWFAAFELRSDLVLNGAYAWMRSSGDYTNAMQFTPIPGGSTGPFNGAATVTLHASAGFPALSFLVNNTARGLTPSVMYGTPTTGHGAAALSQLFIAYLGAIAEIMVWDYDLTTNQDAYTQAVQYVSGRYSSLTSLSLAMTNDAVRAAQYSLSYRGAH